MKNKDLENKVCVNITILYDAEKLSIEEIQKDVEELRRSGTDYGRVVSATLEYRDNYYINLK